MSRRLNEVEDKMVRELMELCYTTGEIAIEVAERNEDELASRARDTMKSFRRRFGLLCYNNRRRSRACNEAYRAIMEEADQMPEEDLARHLKMTVEELRELRSRKNIDLIEKLFDVAES